MAISKKAPSKATRTRRNYKRAAIAVQESSVANSKRVSFEKRWRWHAVPLKGSFMIFSIIGFLISAYMIYPNSFNWGISFMLIFIIMFVASLVSMTKAPVAENN